MSTLLIWYKLWIPSLDDAHIYVHEQFWKFWLFTGIPKTICRPPKTILTHDLKHLQYVTMDCSHVYEKSPYSLEIQLCCCCWVASGVSDSVRPHRRQPTRLPRPWGSPGKNTGVGCHCLLQCMKVKLLSRVRLLVTPWTAAHQAPPSTGFSRQEYWSGGPLYVQTKCFGVWCVHICSVASDSVTPWTVACQVPLSTGFFR